MRAALELVTPDIEPGYEWRREALLAEAEELAILPVHAPPGRFPAMDRDELEARIWRELAWAGYSPAPGTIAAEAIRRDLAFVDVILAAADAYATREAMIAIEVTS